VTIGCEIVYTSGVIKFVYFDIGGVLIRDFSGTDKWEKWKADWGVKPEQDAEFDEFFDRLEEEVDRGRDAETLVPIMEKDFGLKFPPGYSLQEDIGSRFERNESIWPLVRELKTKYPVGLLTNMYPNFLDWMIHKGFMEEIAWDIVVDSSMEGTRKPEKKIFEIASKRAGVEPSEIFFVTNTREHAEAAKRLGWQTFLYDPRDVEKSTRNLREALCL
jgi:FMN phosphatase YigB (HAD superfamily)